MTYHVVPIGLTVLLIYLFSLYLSSTGFTGKHSHRRFWNWILLGSFLIAGLFGLFLALKITYGWNITFTETLLRWHVEIGIIMVYASVIHLTWHLAYYFRGKHKQDGSNTDKRTEEHTYLHRIKWVPLLLLTGFASSSAQFILIREAVILGGGTESSAGLFLWLWLIIAAAGALTGRRSGITSIKRMIWTLIAGMALAPVCFLLMNTIVLNQGQTPSFFQMLLILSVSVAPVTYISSLVFVRLSQLRQAAGISPAGNSFGAETVGSVAAGIITALTVTIRIPNYELYLLIILISSACAVWFTGYNTKPVKTALAAVIPLGAVIIMTHPDLPARSLLLRGVRVEKSIDTPFGNISAGSYGDEKTVYFDQRPLFYNSDVISAEEDIHYALMQRKRYDKVMLISGGLIKHLPEIEKYDINELDYLEPDRGIIAVEGAHDTICGKMKVKVLSRDPLTYLRKNKDNYDAIIQLIPPPSTLSVSRYYTLEYMQIIKRNLSPDGIFLCTPMPYYNYSPESYRKGFSPLYNALSFVFGNIVLIPGSSLYAVASDSQLNSSVALLADSSHIETTYVNSDYLNDSEISMRRDQILSQVDHEAGVNTAQRPVSSLFANMLSLERMGMNSGIIVLLVIMILITLAFAASGGSMMMYASSAGLAGFGMIMIFILQMAVGNIYILSSIILTLLMAGLAAGAAWGNTAGLKKLIICAIPLTALYIITGLLSPALVTSSPVTVLAVIFVILPVAGFFTGAVYRILTFSGTVKATGSVYAADLAGSALGYLTVATILVPLAGIANSCYILAGFIFLSVIIASVTIKH